MKKKELLLVLIIVTCLFGCEKEEKKAIQNETPKVVTFSFMAGDNNYLSVDISGSIDHDEKKIEVALPANTSLRALTPTITVTEGAIVEPNSKTQQDFRKAVVYTLSGEGLEKTQYTVKASVEDSENAEIKSFTFLASKNTALSDDISAIIEGNVIKFEVSDAIDISALTPTIEISDGATIDPGNETPVDFTNEVKYTVTAQDGATKVEYPVEVTIMSSDTEISKFQFTVNGRTYDADINNTLFRITLKLPYNTDLTNLTPVIEINEAASITPAGGEAQDFSSVVVYEVTAQDGSKQQYLASIITMTPEENDRAVLEELYNANKDYNTSFTYLDWDLEADNMDNWQGVTIIDGRVTGLLISTVYINEIPKRIGELSELQNLTIVGVQLRELPGEVGNLTKLEKLSLYNNELTSLPTEIGNLTSVQSIHLQNNDLDALPVEIGLMTSLLRIEVQNNSLNTLPVEIADIPNLVMLNIKNNPLTDIPQVICDKTTSNGLGIVITKDAEDTCN